MEPSILPTSEFLGAAARCGLVASCCLHACDCAVLAAVVDDAGGVKAGQCSSGVLCQCQLATSRGES